MKNTRLALVVLFAILITVSSFFKHPANGSVKGTVNPADGAIRASVISAIDSFKSIINNEGVFVITNVKMGSYNLVIEAKPPYKNAVREGVLVTEDGTTDVGEIKLNQ